jgi:hypothetical protein
VTGPVIAVAKHQRGMKRRKGASLLVEHPHSAGTA